LKPAAPGIAGAVLNGLITHYKIVIRGARSLTASNRFISLIAALLIGLGSTYVVRGYYEFAHSPVLPNIYRAVFFISSAGGLELILWLTGHASRLADKLEDHYIQVNLDRRKKVRDKIRRDKKKGEEE